MPSDYKYANRDRFDQRKSPMVFLRRIVLLIILLSILVYGFYFIDTRKSDELILTGQYAQAEKHLNRWKWLPLVNGRVYERIGTAELLAHGSQAGLPYFQTAERKKFFRPVSIWQDVLKV